MKTLQFKTTGQTTRSIIIAVLSTALLSACSGVQIERAPIERFNEAGYQSYSWRDRPIENTANSDDLLYQIGPSLRASVDDNLTQKGYLLKEAGGDFVINFEFRTALSAGVPESTASNIDPVPGVIVNRAPDQATIDNAYALSGVRELNSILLNFEEAQNQSLVWSVSMSRIVENLNRDNGAKVRKMLGQSVTRALRPLSDAKQ